MRGWAPAAEASEGEAARDALRDWARSRGEARLAQTCEALAGLAPEAGWRALTGPTGEANLYAAHPREAVLCLAGAGPDGDADRLLQLAAVLAVGSRAVWPADARALFEQLPHATRERVSLAQDWRAASVQFDAVLHHGPADERFEILLTLADRPGPIVGVTTLAAGDTSVPLERLLIERPLGINTAAAGGNASLMTIG